LILKRAVKKGSPFQFHTIFRACYLFIYYLAGTKSIIIMRLPITLLLFWFLPFIGTFGSHPQKVEVTITGIKSTQGRLCIAIFVDNEGFKKESPCKDMKISKERISGNTTTVEFELLPGVYGISVLDDENCNGKMDYNMVGIPKEGFGFSNYYHRGITKPHFDQFKFEVSNSDVKVLVELKYM